MTLNWKHIICGGGLLITLRHIGFALGFMSQVVAEGFADGVRARVAVSQDAATVTPAAVLDEIKKDIAVVRDT